MKRIRFGTIAAALMITAAAVIFTGCGSGSSDVEQYDYTGFVMGTVLSETVYTTGDDITEDVEKELSETEDRLISWRKSGSEIAKINESAGKKAVKVSGDTAECLRSVLKMAEDHRKDNKTLGIRRRNTGDAGGKQNKGAAQRYGL